MIHYMKLRKGNNAVQQGIELALLQKVDVKLQTHLCYLFSGKKNYSLKTTHLNFTSILKLQDDYMLNFYSLFDSEQ